MTSSRLRARLAAHDAAPALAVGQLVRVSNPLSRYDQMTGTLVQLLGGMTKVRLTSWGTEHIVPLADLTPVERGPR